MRILLVALAGGAGAVLRYLLGEAVARPHVLWVTLGINVIGSLLLGALVGAAARRDLSPVLVTTLGVGLLGGFTTFSTFSVDTLQLLRGDRPGAALLYVLASVGVGVAAAGLGYTLASRT